MDAAARFEALIIAELADEFEIGPTLTREVGARTLLAHPRTGVEGLLALHVSSRGTFPSATAELARERSYEAWTGLRHPHLARLVRRGATPGLRWCAVRASDGGSLATRLAADGAMPIGRAIGLAAQLGDALHAAHSVGMAHGRLAASHVMLDAEGGAVLTGFGFAVHASGDAAAERRPAIDQAALAYLVYQCVSGDLGAGPGESSVDYWRVPAAIRPVIQQARGARLSSRYRDLPR